MGWCSGTSIFDPVVKDLLDNKELDNKSKKKIIKKLIDTLEDQDWDCQCDSDYYRNPIVKSVFKELHPDWDLDE